MTNEEFETDFQRFKMLSDKTAKRFTLLWEDRHPCLNDKITTTHFDRHYVYHAAWAARILAKTRPTYHVDIASSLFFNALVSAFIPFKFYDYRPADLKLSNFTSEHTDLCKLPFADKSIESLSCMHVIEHIGLGRYGDPLDPDGDLKAISELKRVLAVEGLLLFVVPVGKPKILFNAHRIYSYDQILEYFSCFKLQEFALIPDDSKNGGLIYNAHPEIANNQNYACGCFWFKRINE